MKYTLLCLLVLLSIAAPAKKNGRQKIDSLTNALSDVTDDSTRFRVLARLSLEVSASNPRKGVAYSKSQLAIAKSMKWEKAIGHAYAHMGINYQSLSKYDSSLICFEQAKQSFIKLKDTTQIAETYFKIAYTYLLSGEFDKSLEYNFLTERMYQQVNDSQNLASLWGNISAAYLNKSDLPKALEYIFKAQKLNEETGQKYRSAGNLGTIASIYLQQQEYDKALEYYHKAMDLNEIMGNSSAIAGNLGNIGAVYSYLENDSLALGYMLKALEMYKQIGQKANVAIVSGNIGEIYTNLNNYTEAISYLYRAFEFSKETGNKSTQAAVLNMLGNCYMHIAIDTARAKSSSNEIGNRPYINDGRIPKGKQAQLQKAREFMREALLVTPKGGNQIYLAETYQRISKIDSLLGNYKDALAEFHKYVKIRDSTYSKQNKIDITNLITQREIDLKNKQIEINKLVVSKNRNERVFFLSGIGVLLLIIVIILRNYANQKKTTQLLSQAKERSDDLLLNILPKEVADELKDKGKAEARQYDGVTVMFTDFVDFTQAGERMSPQELIMELDTCFKAFDEIIRKYGFEKIKTIGDAYLAVCGLPMPDAAHAEKVINAAKEIISFMQDRRAKLGNRTFEVRIGISSGSVVAGIVGVMKFAYDIWGDTVNTAARMEQNSEPGKINISQVTHDLVKNKFKFTDRGEILVKNKGEMRMYFVD